LHCDGLVVGFELGVVVGFSLDEYGVGAVDGENEGEGVGKAVGPSEGIVEVGIIVGLTDRSSRSSA